MQREIREWWELVPGSAEYWRARYALVPKVQEFNRQQWLLSELRELIEADPVE